MKKLFSVILFLSSVFAASAAVYTGSCGANLTWTVDTDAQTLTISGTGAMDNYSHSTNMPWYPYKDQFSSLVLEPGIVSISNFAFSGYTGLTGNLIIPEGVMHIGAEAFLGCSGFTRSLELPSTLLRIESGAFSGCRNFISIYTHASTPPVVANVAAFRNVPTSTPVYVPCGCAEAYRSAQYWSQFTDIRALNYINRGTCGDNLTWEFSCDGVLTISGTGAMYDYTEDNPAPWYHYRSQMTSLVLEEGITHIGDYAFLVCSGFTGSLYFRRGLTSIGESAFAGCTGFNGTLYFPSSVTSIGSRAFHGCTGFTGDLTIPNNVTEIGEAAFHGCIGFTGNLTILGRVTTILPYSFWGCSGFTGLTLPSSLTSITFEAFYGCSGFTGTLSLPSGLTSIGFYAFYGCSGFTGGLNLPNGLTYLGQHAFAGCTGFTGNLNIPSGLISIFAHAFEGCTGFNGSLSIPANVAFMNSNAFAGCSNLYSINMFGTTPPSIYSETFSGIPTDIPVYVPCGSAAAYRAARNWSNFTNIRDEVTASGSCGDNLTWSITCSGMLIISGTGAMTDFENINSAPWSAYRGQLTSLVLEEGITHIGNGAFYDCSFTGTLTLPNTLTSIGDVAFGGCTGFTGELVLPSALTAIGGMAFAGCTGFTGTLSLPSTLTAIGGMAFAGCTGFTGTLSIPEGVTEIGYATFQDCSGINALRLPASVAELGFNAFSGCSGLTSITVERAEPASIADAGVFYNVPTDIPVNVPCGSVEAYQAAPYWSSFTNIRQAADCPCEIASGSCGDNLTWVLTCDYGLIISGTGAMYDYERTSVPWNSYRGRLTSLVLEEGITHIGNYAFYNCSGFTGSLIIPASVTSIGSYAFYGCGGFTGSLTIPGSVTSIGDGAFHGCIGFTGSLTIQDGVTTIANGAFYNCYGFTGSLTIPGSVTSIGNYAFYNCLGFSGSLTIPASVTSIGNYAFYFCSGLTGNLVIPEGVTTIGNSAFYKCSGFTGSLTIPGSVTEIGEYAFSYCSGLSAIYAESATPPTVYSNTFGNIPTTIPVYVPCGAVEAYREARNWSRFTNIQALGYIDRGTCGDNLTWELSCDGTLTISGTGAMYDYTEDYPAPWYQYRSQMTSLVLEEGITHIGHDAFLYCSGFTGDLVIPEGVTEIGRDAFYYCTGFTGTLTIPAGVTTIGNSAFAACSGFTGSLTIPEGVTTIGDYAFYNCSGFTGNLVIPEGVTTIGSHVFWGCDGFTGELHLPSGITKIGLGAFYWCRGLTGNLVIPEGVTTIGDYAFYNCSGLSAIYAERETPPTVYSNTFRSVPTAIPVNVPCGSVEAYQAAQYWSSFTNITDQRYQLTVSSEDEAKGAVAGAFDCPAYTLIATPAEGYTFSEWSDGNTDNPRLLTPTEDTVLTAIFEEACSVIITSDDETMGTVSLSAE